MTGLTDVIDGCIVMTYGARQRCPKSRTSEPCSPPAAAVRSTARCGRAFSTRLLHFSPAGLSLSPTSSALKGASSGERGQTGVHSKASAQFDSAGAVVCICQKNLDQRSRDSSAAGVSATRGRSWLSRSRYRNAPFSWSIALIVIARQTGSGVSVAGSRPATCDREHVLGINSTSLGDE
jgi:hypothetical protein